MDSEFAVRHAIYPQLIGHDFLEITAVCSEQALEEPFHNSAIPPGLETNIYNITILCPGTTRGYDFGQEKAINTVTNRLRACHENRPGNYFDKQRMLGNRNTVWIEK